MQTPRPATWSQNAIPRPLKIFFTAYLLYTAATWISCAIHAHLGHSKAYSSPFIHQSWDSYTDLRTYWLRFHLYFHRSEFFRYFPSVFLAYFSYPAPGAFLYWCFYRPKHYVIGYLALATVWAGLLTWSLFRLLRRRGVGAPLAAAIPLVMLAAAFPFDFMIERGNVELAVWILVSLGLYLYLRHRDSAAATLLGIAASTKIFPVIFCGILLQRRRYAALALALLVAVLFTVFCIWFAGPTFAIAFHGFNETLNNYQQSYSIPARVADVGMDHSFFALIKVLGQRLGLNYKTWLHPYYLIAGISALALFFGRALRLPLANQLLFITIMAVGLPPNSFDYTLVHLYAPWTVLCLAAFRSARNGIEVPGITPLLLGTVPLLSPFNLFVRHGIRFGGQAQTLFLIALLALTLIYPIADDLWAPQAEAQPVRRRVAATAAPDPATS